MFLFISSLLIIFYISCSSVFFSVTFLYSFLSLSPLKFSFLIQLFPSNCHSLLSVSDAVDKTSWNILLFAWLPIYMNGWRQCIQTPVRSLPVVKATRWCLTPHLPSAPVWSVRYFILNPADTSPLTLYARIHNTLINTLPSFDWLTNHPLHSCPRPTFTPLIRNRVHVSLTKQWPRSFISRSE